MKKLAILTAATLLTASVATASDPVPEPIDWQERALQCEAEKQILITDLKQYMEENQVLQNWRKADNRSEKLRVSEAARKALKTYKDEKAAADAATEPEPEKE